MMAADRTRTLAQAQHLAAKLLALRARTAPKAQQTGRYGVFMATPRGYTHVTTLIAPTLHDACSQHVRAWHSRVSCCAVVMRAPSGKRYSYDDSRRVVEGGNV